MNNNQRQNLTVLNTEEEHRQVAKDLKKVLLVNGLILILMLALFFWNRTSGSVDSFFANLIKF